MMYNKAIAFIVGYYGEEHQLLQLAEECAELVQAAIKLHQALTDDSAASQEKRGIGRYHVVEEIADVLIMIEQIAHVEDFESVVRLEMDEKIQRQLDRIRDEAEAAKQSAPRWLEDEYGYCRCSRCGYEHDQPEITTPYCPECGARMGGMTEVSGE